MSDSIKRWIEERYGSRRGFILTLWYRLLGRLGRYRQYQDVDWNEVERLVFICKGNICRSAYAEAVARSLGVEAVSCGLDTIESAPANSAAIAAAQRSGIDLRQHRTTPVMYLILRKTDLLVAMEPWQTGFLEKQLFRSHQYTLLGLWASPPSPYIQDPYGTTSAYFDRCFSYIHDAVSQLAKITQ